MTRDTPCPCGSGLALETCCQPIVDGAAKAPTAEALMRSRYTAYTLQDIDYLARTLDPGQLRVFDREATAMWARDANWVGLEIVKTSAGCSQDETGTVEFKARFKRDGVVREHHELSEFRKIGGSWLYCGGRDFGPAQFQREAPKIGRNAPCPCGSGKKFKKCCGKGVT